MANLPHAPITDKAVQAYLQAPSAVLILHGPTGVGKKDVAYHVLANILGVDKEKLMSYPYLIRVEADKDSISIDSIRQMQSALVRSVPGDQAIRRAVFIENAHQLTTEAQNALLKTLEESPEDTVVIMTVVNLQHLLSTVVSRSRQLAVLPIDESLARETFGDTPEVTKAFHMSGGRTALLKALLDDAEHPLLTAVAEAKEVLKKSPYERLALVNSLSKDRSATQELLDALQLLARVSLTTAVKAGKNDQAKQWHHINKNINDAKTSLKRNAGAKLVLTDLFLHL